MIVMIDVISIVHRIMNVALIINAVVAIVNAQRPISKLLNMMDSIWVSQIIKLSLEQSQMYSHALTLLIVIIVVTETD